MNTPQHEAQLESIKALIGRRFKHFKGTTYMVVRAVFDATADSWMVGYVKKGDDGNGTLFTRTYEDFTSKVERPRFEEV